MALATIPGYPRIGKRRELKRALEGYWSRKRSAEELEETAAAIRLANWEAQTAAGLDLVPVNDFSLYDQVLDTCALVGAIPPRFGWAGDTVDLDLLFAMARGGAGDEPARAMELTKWFDTNYHYLVPELSADQTFHLASDKPFAELAEAQSAGIPARLLLQTAYGHVGEAYPSLAALPVDGIGLDFVRGPENLDFIAQRGFPED